MTGALGLALLGGGLLAGSLFLGWGWPSAVFGWAFTFLALYVVLPEVLLVGVLVSVYVFVTLIVIGLARSADEGRDGREHGRRGRW